MKGSYPFRRNEELNCWEGVQRFYRQYEKYILVIGLYILLTAGYLVINRINAVREGVYLHFLIDEKIPFIPSFVWIYVLYYIALVAPVLVVRDIFEYRRAILAYLLNFLLCFTIFLIVPVKIARPEMEIKDMTSALLFMLFYADHPTNILPSLHVGNAFLAAIISLHFHIYYGLFWLLFAISIYASTVFIKQHYLIDGVPSIAIAYILYFTFFRSEKVWKGIPFLSGDEVRREGTEGDIPSDKRGPY